MQNFKKVFTGFDTKQRTTLRRPIEITKQTKKKNMSLLSFSNRMISSRKFVPPVVTITFKSPMCLLNSMAICDVCRASSRVGTRTIAKIKSI